MLQAILIIVEREIKASVLICFVYIYVFVFVVGWLDHMSL